MDRMIRNAKEEIMKLEKTLKKIDDFMVYAPEGCLKWQNKSGKTYYYQQYLEQGANESTSKWNRRYIKKKDVSLARNLAQKHYYVTTRPLLEKRLDSLRKFIKSYPQEAEDVFAGLSDERKLLVTPLGISVEEKIEQWNKEVYEKNCSYPENLRYETEQGDMVRSKSEVIIANILYQHQKSILYKYERPLKVVVDGRNKIIYPDFTVMNVHTGKVVYWEHAGRMDDSYYANDFVKKQIYI